MLKILSFLTALMLTTLAEGVAVAQACALTAKAEIAQANDIIQKDFGFKGLKLKVNARTLQEQMKAEDQVSLSTATSLAMALILDDFTAIESPLNIAAEGDATTEDKRHAAEVVLRNRMAKTGTTLGLYLGKAVGRSIYPPEYGESEKANWIFVLRIPTLSDHIYWVIVDRQSGKAYLYGFN